MGTNLVVSSTSNTGPTTGATFIDITGAVAVTATLIPYTPNDKAATLTDGTLACLAGATDTIKIFTFTPPATFTQVAQFDGGTIVTPSYYLNINNGQFWGLINIAGVDASFYRFNASGTITVGPIGEVTGTGNGRPFCVSIDETIGYWYDFTTSIKRWDLVNNVALSDLITTIDPTWFIDGIYNVQGSTDIVVAAAAVVGAGNNKRFVARYTAAGAVVYSNMYYSIPGPSTDGFYEFALATTLDAFWSRNAGPPSYALITDQRFHKVRFSDGTVTNTVDVAVVAGPTPGNTCFLADLTNSAPVPPTPGGGIYVIEPGARHDTYNTISTKIPNPTVRTALVGE